MKFLTVKLHGLGDYAAAAVLIVAPFFLGLKEQSMIAHWASIAGGVGLIIYSLLTDFVLMNLRAHATPVTARESSSTRNPYL